MENNEPKEPNAPKIPQMPDQSLLGQFAKEGQWTNNQEIMDGYNAGIKLL